MLNGSKQHLRRAAPTLGQRGASVVLGSRKRALFRTAVKAERYLAIGRCLTVWWDGRIRAFAACQTGDGSSAPVTAECNSRQNSFAFGGLHLRVRILLSAIGSTAPWVSSRVRSIAGQSKIGHTAVIRARRPALGSNGG